MACRERPTIDLAPSLDVVKFGAVELEHAGHRRYRPARDHGGAGRARCAASGWRPKPRLLYASRRVAESGAVGFVGRTSEFLWRFPFPGFSMIVRKGEIASLVVTVCREINPVKEPVLV